MLFTVVVVCLAALRVHFLRSVRCHVYSVGGETRAGETR
jgi:hypothetical protein